MLRLLLALALSVTASVAADTPSTRWQAIDRKPFDRRNFTQGLEIRDGVLWVSSGLYGRSAIRRYRLDDLSLIDTRPLPGQLFAEGLTLVGDEVFLLTWRARKLLVFDVQSLSLRRVVPLQTEGWGLTHHGNTLWYSDGSHRLYRFDATATEPDIVVLEVTRDGQPLNRLNELEWIDGEIWANVWQTDQIVRIDPTTGAVIATIDLDRLFPRQLRPRGTDVLNGIARDPASGKIWVTGKFWPSMYAIAPADHTR